MGGWCGSSGSVPKSLLSIWCGNSSSVPKAILNAWCGDSSRIPKLIFGALAVTITPPSGAGASGNLPSYTFTNLTANPVGGSGSYLYSWTYDSADGGTWGSLSGVSNAQTFQPRVTGVTVGASATLRVTVTDTVTGATASATIYLSYTRLT